MNKKFGICIPTYNRKIQLKNSIDSFINDAIKFEIPIYISDNCSTDGTEELIKEYINTYEYIYYKKQEKNLGINLNMLSVIEMAETDYALWLGDDDILNNEAIPEILESLKSNPDLAIIKLHDDYDLSFTYTNPYDFYKDYGMIGIKEAMHFSTLIVDVKKIKAVTNKDRYMKTLHLYAGIILDYLMNEYIENNKICVIQLKKKIVEISNADKSWAEVFFKTFLVYIPIWIDNLLPEYKDNDKVKQCIELFYKEYYGNLGFINCSNFLKMINKLSIETDKKIFILTKIYIIDHFIHNIENFIYNIIKLIKEIWRRPRTFVEILKGGPQCQQNKICK